MDAIAKKIAQLLAAGDPDGAEAYAAGLAATDHAGHAVARAALAVAEKDADACREHARLAHRLAPSEPLPLRYLALAEVMDGDPAAAEPFARQAVERDTTTMSRFVLANVLLGTGRAAEAAVLFRGILEREPKNAEALRGLGNCSFRQDDYQAAIGWLARAYEANPDDKGALQDLIELLAHSGRLLGAVAALQLARKPTASDEVRFILDLVELNLTKMIAGQYPPPNVVDDADRTVSAVVRSAARRPPRMRLVVARALADLDRLDEARRLAAELERTPLDQADRADLLFLQGFLAARAGDAPAALEAYLAAFRSDEKRVDACCNAISILLESGDAAAFTTVGELLARVPPELKETTAALVFNEAIYLKRTDRPAQARDHYERVLRMTGGSGQLGELARHGLEELGRPQ